MSSRTAEAERQQISAGDVGKIEETALVKPETGGAVSSMMERFIADAGEGERFSAREMAIPFLQIAQSNSPQAKEEDPRYIDGLKPGMIFNTISGKIYDHRVFQGRPEPEGMKVVLALTKFMVVEWLPDRGGFVGQHVPDDPILKKAKGVAVEGKTRPVLRLPSGNDLVDTQYYYALVVDGQDVSWAVMGLTSTQLRTARRFNRNVSEMKIDVGGGRKVSPKLFQLAFSVKTEVQRQKTGDKTWWGWKFDYLGTIPEFFGEGSQPIYEAALAYREAVEQGIAQVAQPPADDADGDVPF